jgi:hypothetical protein
MNTSGRTGAPTSGPTETAFGAKTSLYNSVENPVKGLSSPAKVFIMVFLSTAVRPSRGPGDEALARLAAETEAVGVHFGGGDLAAAVATFPIVARLGLMVGPPLFPMPERPLAHKKRLPRLAAPDRDERAAAIALVLRGLADFAPMGIRQAVLDLGGVALAADRAAFRRAFARRALADDEGLANARAERQARAGEVLDACRYALEGVVRDAERRGVTLLLAPAGSPWQAPSPREIETLTGMFAGAPLGHVWDPARLSVLCTLGLPLSDDRLRRLAEGAALALENDAVGLDTGFLPGMGERDARVAALSAPAGAPRIVTGRPDVSDAEVAAAVARFG